MRAVVKEIFLVVGFGIVFVAARAQGQDTTAARPLVRAYISCSQCDEDYLREQVGFVNLVRDPRLADVTVQVTGLTNASGGRTYTIEVIGSRRGARTADTLLVDIGVNMPDIEGRDMLVRGVKVALIPFLHGTEAMPYLNVTYQPPARSAKTSSTRGATDRWNGWVFRVGGQGSVDGDDNYQSRGADWSLRASRVTEALKLSLSAKGDYKRTRYELSDSTTLVGYSRSWSTQGVIAQSLGDHLSLGFLSEAGSSIFENTKQYVRAGPVIEYDIYPYREATQRQIMVRYSVGARSNRYVDTTIYSKLAESRPHHELSITPNIQRPWGDVFGSTVWSQYLDDPTKRRLTTNLGINFRITAGLNVNFYGQYSYIRDQLSLSGKDLTNEERLLRLRELQSGRSFFTALGLSYTFGSVFSNVVNPRLRL